jgi:hypothetical protein
VSLVAAGSDALDHAAADLFARILDQTLWEVEVAPGSAMPSELLERIEETKPAVLVITLLPPGGITHARYLCKRIRQRFSDLKIVIGRWANTSTDNAKIVEVLRNAGADEVTTTMASTRSFLSGWQGVFATASPTESPNKSKVARRAKTIGTAPA